MVTEAEKRQTLPGLPAGVRRGKRVGLVAMYESGGRYNIDPNSKLSNPFITIKSLFYDDVFHHAAECLFVGTAASDIIGKFFDEVGASVPAERFTDFGDHAKNISISTGKLHGDVGLGIWHYFTLPFLPGHPMPSKLRLPERSAASSASTAFW